MSENPTHQTLAHVEQGSGAAVYERLRAAIAEAMTVTDVQHLRISLEQMKVHAKLAKDRDLMADLMALQQRNERRLGELLIAAREAGQIHLGGRPSKGNAKTSSEQEGVLDRLTLKQAGIDWKLSSRAQKLAGVPERDFEEVVERARQKIRAGGAVVVNPAKDHSTKEKAVHRAIREAQLAERQKALPVAKFGVILADPEWPFDVRSDAGKDRSAENHYPTSTLEVIAQRPVETIAADDAVLFLWVTMPHLAAGSHVAVIEGWGFSPKAVVIWDKVETGTGYWVRNRVEALVIAVRGKVPAPAPGTQWEDLIRSPKGAHSEKPDWAYELIEAYYPNLPKIELNARRRRDGWMAWGFEAPEAEPQEITFPAVVEGSRSTRGADVGDGGETQILSESNDGLTREASPLMGSEADGVASRLSVGSGSDAPTSESADPTIGASPAPGGAAANGSEGSEQTGVSLAAETNQPGTANEAAGTRPVPSVRVETAPGPVQRSYPGNSATPLGVTGGESAAPSSLARDAAEGGEGAAGAGALPANLPRLPSFAQVRRLEDEPQALPPLTNEQLNDAVRAAYAVDRPLAEIMAATGLSKDAVKSRAKRMGLGSRDRQRASASAFATQQHQNRRAAE